MNFGKYLEDILSEKKKSFAWLGRQMGYNIKTFQGKISRGAITAQDFFEAMIILGFDVDPISKIIRDERIFFLNGFEQGSGDALSLMLFYKTIQGEEIKGLFKDNFKVSKAITDGVIKNIRLMVNPQDRYASFEINCENKGKQDIWPTGRTSLESVIAILYTEKGNEDDSEDLMLEADYERILEWAIDRLKNDNLVLTQFIND